MIWHINFTMLAHSQNKSL